MTLKLHGSGQVSARSGRLNMLKTSGIGRVRPVASGKVAAARR